MPRRILTGDSPRFQRVRPGDTVMITKDDLAGTKAIVANTYEGGIISVRIKPSECRDPTLAVGPDGYVHWLAKPDEYERYNASIHLT